MLLSIDSLQELGSFTGAPVKREIEWQQGGATLSATVFVRSLSFRSAVADINAATGKSDFAAGRIASCICDEQGVPIFKAEDLTGESDPQRGALNESLTMALLSVITEVNNMGKQESSAPVKSSGMSSSPTALGDEQLPKPKSESPMPNIEAGCSTFESEEV